MYFHLSVIFVSITSPAFAADMRYPAGEEPLELPAHSALNAQLSRSAQNRKTKAGRHVAVPDADARRRPQRLGALPAGGIVGGERPNRAGGAGRSADRGLWYYYNLLEDDAFNSIQHSATYQSIWPPPKRAICSTPVTMKARPATRCRTEKAPPEGWPTVIFLHTYGKAAAISPEERLLFGEMGVAYIEINGTQMLSAASAGRITATRAPTPPFSVRCNSWLRS